MRKKLINIDIGRVQVLFHEGLGSRKIAKELNCSRDCIRSILNDLNLRHPKTPTQTIGNILSHVHKNSDNGCWEWQGRKFKTGYGMVTFSGKTKRVHRIVYELMVGCVPSNLFVCHKCDNPICCNPDHLFIGTNSDNMIDCTIKGRNPAAKISADSVVSIREQSLRGRTINEIAEEFKLSTIQVRKIIKKEKWAFI